mgnify:FL=1
MVLYDLMEDDTALFLLLWSIYCIIDALGKEIHGELQKRTSQQCR